MKYQIGQPIWRASWGAVTDYVTCPDCGGEGRIRVLLHDDTMVSIECEGCRRGYERPDGKIRVYTRQPMAILSTITGVEIRDGKTEWQTQDSYRTSEHNLFEDEASCLARAQEMAAEHDLEERDRINKKEKNTRSWSWNAHYHRREIRDAERRIEYHKSKLAVASVKAKQDNSAPVEK